MIVIGECLNVWSSKAGATRFRIAPELSPRIYIGFRKSNDGIVKRCGSTAIVLSPPGPTRAARLNLEARMSSPTGTTVSQSLWSL